MENIKEILSKVESGEISSKEGASLIRSLSEANTKIKYAKKIKIKIHDRENNKKIALPAIPIWLLEKIMFAGITLSNYFSKKEDGSFKKGGIKIKAKDLKLIFSLLKHIPPCKLVDIDDKDAFVKIYMI